MRHVAAMIVVAMLAGCDGRMATMIGRAPDPRTCRMHADAEAVAFADRENPGGYVAIFVPALDPFRRPPLHAGDRLTVVADDYDRDDATRPVRVHVEAGALAGQSGTMARADIRPR